MATRSRIAIENQDETVTSVYCHWDGYLQGVGKTLFEHYDREKTEQLIELGSLSALDKTIGDTIAYHRDRNEDFNQTMFSNVEDLFRNGFANGADYIYCLTKEGVWMVQHDNFYNENPQGIRNLSEILQEELEEEGI